MPVPVLIVTPAASFGELIRQTLQEVGGYQVVLAATAQDAILRAGRLAFAMAILDADIQDMLLPGLGSKLREIRPGICLIAIPKEGNPDPTVGDGFVPDGYLAKPFYLPDLIHTVRDLLGTGLDGRIAKMETQVAVKGSFATLEAGAQVLPPAPVWLKNAGLAFRYLKKLAAHRDVEAALIIDQGMLWASSGEIEEEALQELAQFVIGSSTQRTVDLAVGGEVARFVRSDATHEEYLLYSTSLNRDMLLGLAFIATKPFSQARMQVKSMVRALHEIPQEAGDDTAGEGLFSNELDWRDESESVLDLENDDLDLPVEPLFPPDSVPPPNPEKKSGTGEN